MDKELEKIYNNIRKDEDFADLTDDEVLEMAKMELGSKEIKNYTQSTKTKERPKRERKVDDNKKILLSILKECLEEYEDIKVGNMFNEVSLDIQYENEDYTIKLTKHRKKK